MFLYERLEELKEKVENIEENFMIAEDGLSIEETLAYKLKDIENYIGKIEDVLSK